MSTPAEPNTGPYVFASRDGAFRFTVQAPKLTVRRELAVNQTHDDPDRAPLQVTSGGVEFSATVTLAGDSTDEWGRVGWIQTIEPGRQSVTYEKPDDPTVRGEMVRRNEVRMRDGDSPQGDLEGDTAALWYDAASSSAQIKPGEAVTVTMDDQPNVAFHPGYSGRAAPWIKDWRAVAVAGTMSFCTWLIAEATVEKEIVYLYHVLWTADFGTGLREGALDAPTGGFSITAHGPGKGGQEPCFDRNPINEDTCPWKPDTSLVARRPAFAPARPATGGGARVVMGSRAGLPGGGKQAGQSPQPGGGKQQGQSQQPGGQDQPGQSGS